MKIDCENDRKSSSSDQRSNDGWKLIKEPEVNNEYKFSIDVGFHVSVTERVLAGFALH